jgi:hypothetical protein
MRMQTVAAAALMAGVSMMAVGCRVDEHKNGGGEDVKIATPFGGMSVKTSDTGVIDGLGLPVYPGAELVKKKNNGDKSDGSADVNMSFGSFQLRVKAVSYRTPDSPEKVQAFYRKALSRYGVVIDCVDNRPVGTPVQTPEGLTCADEKKKNHINTDVTDSSKHELKTGSEQHQHIVGIDPEGAGTKFGLVALDLPGHITFDGDGKSDNKNEKVQ